MADQGQGFDAGGEYDDGDLYSDPYGGHDAYADAELTERAQAIAEEQVGPLREQVEEMRVRSEAEQLVDQYPELGQQEVAVRAIEAAQALAAEIGDPQLAASPALWRIGHMLAGGSQQAGRAGEPGSFTEALLTDPDDPEGMGGRCLPFG